MGTRWCRARSVALAALVLAVAPVVSQGTAGASDPGLANLVLPTIGPGFVVAPPGPLNGPLTSASYASMGPEGLSLEQDFGQAQGYLRVFRDARTQASVVILILQLPSSEAVSSYLAGFANSAARERKVLLTVPGVPGSMSYATSVRLRSEAVGDAYLAAFGHGALACLVAVVSPSQDHLSGGYVAQREAGTLLGSFDQTPLPSQAQTDDSAYVGGEVFGAMFVVAVPLLFALFFIERQRRAKAGPHRPLPAPAGVPPGWYPDPQDPTQLCVWDGTRWTARGAHTPSGWTQQSIP